MTCSEIESDIVDLARGLTTDPLHEASITRHLTSCRRCAELLDAERAMSAALHRLAEATPQPATDAGREAAILAAFETAWARPRRDREAQGWLVIAAAVLLAFGAAGLWMTVSRATQPREGTRWPVTGASSESRAQAPLSEPPRAPQSLSAASHPFRHAPKRVGRAVAARRAPEFVPWPGASTLPAFESGELVRLDLPASVLPSLGLLPPAASQGDVVRADVLIGQDGFARAVRLVP